jgi:uncharacterized LabA/DUF88 family protein
MIGIFVDTTNLYRTVYKKHKNKLCYDLYREKVGKILGDHHSDELAIAYVMQVANEASGFIGCLRAASFLTKTKRPLTFSVGDREIRRCNWHVEMLVDVFKNIDKLGTIILGSSDSELLPFVKFLKEEGVKVIILASLIPKRLAEVADQAIEITKDLLECQDEVAT